MFTKAGILKNRAGFTMMELVVTLVIMAIVAAFAIPIYLGFVKDSQAKECASNTAMLTRDCQQAQKNLTKSPTESVKIDGDEPAQVTLRNNLFFQAIDDEFNVNLKSLEKSDIKVIEKDGKIMVAGICKDGGNYYTQTDNGSLNVYCDKHDGEIANVIPVTTPAGKDPDAPVDNKVTINYVAAIGGVVSRISETVDASNGSVSGSTATANMGYTFSNWTKNGTVVSPVAAFIKPALAAATYTANFNENDVTITYTAGPGGAVSPTSEVIKALAKTAGGSTATANNGYKFLEWVDSKGNRVGTSMNFDPPKGDVYITTTYTAHFIKLENVDTVKNVEDYFEHLYSNWDPYGWIWNWYAETKIGAVYSYSSWFIEGGTYVAIDHLSQSFYSFFPSTDGFYRWLSLADQKKFIEITTSTPVYKSKNVSGDVWTGPQPTFGNLYEYGNSVYIWTSDDITITPPTDPTATTTGNKYWVKIVGI